MLLLTVSSIIFSLSWTQVDAKLISDSRTDFVALSGVFVFLFGLAIFVVARTQNACALGFIVFMLLISVVYASPREKKKKKIDELKLLLYDMDIKDENVTKIIHKVEKFVSSEVESCDSDGYCVLENGESMLINHEHCLSIRNVTVREAFCAITNLKANCHWNEMVERKKELTFVAYCVKESECEIENSIDVWINRKIDTVHQTKSVVRKRHLVKSLIEYIINEYECNDVCGVTTFKYIYDLLVKQIPASDEVFSDIILKGKITAETEQHFKEESAYSARSYFVQYVLKSEWSGFSVKKMLTVGVILAVLYLVLMIFGPKSFKSYVNMFVFTCVLIVILSCVW